MPDINKAIKNENTNGAYFLAIIHLLSTKRHN
jgi:hypothetical protein